MNKEKEVKVIGGTLEDAIEIKRAEFMWRIDWYRKYFPSELILEKRQLLKEKKNQLLIKMENMKEELNLLYGKDEMLNIMESISRRYDEKEKKKFFKLKKRKEYIEGENGTKWDIYPKFALVIQIFSIYYEFSISYTNIKDFLDTNEQNGEDKLCGIKITTLDRYNRGEASNKTLLILAALLFVVNEDREKNGKKKKELEIFPHLNKSIDRNLYNKQESNIERVKFVFEFYKGTDWSMSDLLKQVKGEEITILDEECLAFVYVFKREMEGWEKLEIEKEKYNAVCKAIFYGERNQNYVHEDEYKKINIFLSENENKIKKIRDKEILYKNSEYGRIKKELCEACALFCSAHKGMRDLEDEHYEEFEYAYIIQEQREIIDKIKEEIMRYDVLTRNNFIRNIEFFSDINENTLLLFNNYEDLNDRGKKEYILFMDEQMQQLDEMYSFSNFCERQEQIMDMNEAGGLLQRLSCNRLERMYDFMLSFSVQQLSLEDWYIFFSIEIVRKLDDKDMMELISCGLKTYKALRRFRKR